jgi:MFS family permease
MPAPSAAGASSDAAANADDAAATAATATAAAAADTAATAAAAAAATAASAADAAAADDDSSADDNDPFPYREVGVICCINMLNSASYLMTYPMLSFMIMSFDSSLRAEEVGYYSGVAEGSFHVGSIVGSLVWGHLSDVYGRRPALLAGLVGTILATLAFGVAPSFGAAVAARVLWGALNGNVGVAKTALSEVCSDRYTARAFSAIGLSNGFGRLLGPALGGLLSEPARKYGWTSPLFVRFPFVLPCIIAASVTFLTLLVAAGVLKETLGRTEAAAAAAAAAATAAPAASESAAVAVAAATTVSADEDESETAGMLSVKAADRRVIVAAPAGAAAPALTASPPPPPPPPPLPPPSPPPLHAPLREESAFAALLRLARDPPVALCVGLYMGLGMTGLVSAELYPLYVINDREHGGFSLDSSDIGLLALSGAPWMIIFQAFCFSRLTTAIGVRRINQASLVLFAVCMATTPLQSLARGLPERAMWAVLFLHYGVTTLVRVTCFTCSFVFTANAALPQDRGKVNGLAQAAVSVSSATPQRERAFARATHRATTDPRANCAERRLCAPSGRRLGPRSSPGRSAKLAPSPSTTRSRGSSSR